MIIHTVSFRIVLNYEDNSKLLQKIKDSKTSFRPLYKNGRFVHYIAVFKNIRFNFNPYKFRQHLIIECEADKIVGTSNVIEEDLERFEIRFSELVQEFLKNNFPIFIRRYPLFRIDYKYDIQFKDDLEIEIFYEIIKRVKDRCFNLNKISPNNFNYSSLYYRPQGKTDSNGNNYFKRGKMNLNSYHRYLKTGRPEDKYVVRLEVQIFSKTINSEYKKNGISKELCNYWNQDSYDEYMKVYEKILYTQDYFRIDVALKLVIDNYSMRLSVKKRLCRLLTLINIYGETKGRKIFSKEYTQSTFYRDIGKLKKIGINPITFGNLNDTRFEKIECLRNFLKR